MFPIKKHFLTGLLACSLASQFAFATEIYRSEDSQGRVTYSDTATARSEQVNIPSRTYRHLHRITRVYDGDTIVLENGQRVRLLGVNTPEVESRHRKNEPGGVAAKEWLQQQLQNEKVYLEFDEEKHDRYKRLLAHLYLPDGKHINVALLENGLAAVNLIPPNLRHADKLIRAQQQAEQQGSGIWSMPAYQPRPLAQTLGKNNGWQRYIGIPKAIKKSRKYTRLILSNQADIRIANHNLELFPALETYLGKPLEIRGWVSRKKDNYSILIHHPSALIFM